MGGSPERELWLLDPKKVWEGVNLQEVGKDHAEVARQSKSGGSELIRRLKRQAEQ